MFTNKWYAEQLEQTIFPYSKMYRWTAQLLNKAMEEQSTHFIWITYQGKQNGSILLTNECCMEQFEQPQILSMTKCMGHIVKIALTFDCGNGEQSTCLGPNNYINPRCPTG